MARRSGAPGTPPGTRSACSRPWPAQTEVGEKTNEVPMAAVVLGQIDLNNKIVTADALHTVKATANHIHEHGGEFVLPVKENRRALFDALDTLPWTQVPIAHTATDKGHGRITTRTIQVLPAPDDLPFPHVNQVFLIERYVTGLHGQPISAVAALGVASPKRSLGSSSSARISPGRCRRSRACGRICRRWPGPAAARSLPGPRRCPAGWPAAGCWC